MPVASRSRVLTEMRLGAANHDPRGFIVGFELGMLAVGNSEYWRMSKGRTFMPQSMRIAYDFGRNVAVEALTFEAEIVSQGDADV